MNSSERPSALFIGGTGTISASCVRRAVAEGMHVTVLNRGNNVAQRKLPAEVQWISADIREPASVTEAVGDRTFDVVANFLCYTGEQAEEAIALFQGKVGQYLHISTASMYHKPVKSVPITESTPRHNPFVAYSREKIAAEDVLMAAYERQQFPVTVVRPSHTYDAARPPLPGDWTVVDRIFRGSEIVSPGDGTSLWTITHAADFALGFVGLFANPRAIGESVHITSDEVYTWDQIFSTLAHAAGVEANIVHVPSEFWGLVAPSWPWSELMVGDLSHSALFDNSKLRSLVPGFRATHSFHQDAREMIAWRQAHPETTRPNARVDAIYDRLVEGYHKSRSIFGDLEEPPTQ